MFEVRPRQRQIPATQKEAPAAGPAIQTANNKGMSAIVADRPPCAGIVPCGSDVHLAAMREQRAGVDANHAANVREHWVGLRSVAALLGAELAGEVQL